jgi:hypothetical protein
MLPGLRILFAITLLSVSVLIFGLGAAAFLRSAHEDVANAPWRPIQTPATARVDLAPPTLAMLRVEPEPIAATPAPKADARPPAATTSAAMEIKLPSAPAPAAEASPPRAEPAETPAAAKMPEPPPASAEAGAPPPAPAMAAPAAEPARDTAPSPVVVETRLAEPETVEAKAAEARAVEAKADDTRTMDTKAAESTEPRPAPTVVAALGPDQAEAQPAIVAEPAPAPPPASEAAASRAPIAVGTDTLKADDKAIDAAPAKVAALGDTGADQGEPLPSKDVKIPHPRIDPAVIEARRKQLLAQQQARARALKARRIAAARARAAQAKAAAAAANNPFGAPANTTTTNATRTN